MPIISATPITVSPVPIPTPTHHSPYFMSILSLSVNLHSQACISRHACRGKDLVVCSLPLLVYEAMVGQI